MNANSFGNRIVMHTFGESHGRAMGVVIDGFPAGVPIDVSVVQKFLDRRKPGTSGLVSQRKELDKVEIVSGVYKNLSLGTPICAWVLNQNARSEDYEGIREQPRHGHADKVWLDKFGHIDHRGGGRSSGRETLCRVIAGSLCEQALENVVPNLRVVGLASKIGEFECDRNLADAADRNSVDLFAARFPFKNSKFISEKLEAAQAKGDSYGGIAEITIYNPPKGLGQPVFHKLKSDLASAAMSLGATLAVDFAEGFESIERNGIAFHSNQKVSQYGGIQGGISSGQTIRFRVYFKPTSSILDVAKKGRHDPCIVPRAIPVLEAMTSFIIMDHWMLLRMDRISGLEIVK